MKAVLTEKPSVARDIAAFLGANTRHEGYYEGKGYCVCWAFGHLVTLKEPNDYDPALKRWSLQSLPIIPDTFELKVIDNSGVKKQFAIIKKLFHKADELICATDAGREGELIFRYILSLSGVSRKQCKRLWLSSLTDEAIGHAFKELRDASNYDNLYAAARCRSEADWIVGLNGTRNMTIRFGGYKMLYSVGRVQTPVLAMIVKRDDSIRHFVPEPFWELLTIYKEVQFKYTGKRFLKKDSVEKLLIDVQRHPLTITGVKSKKEKVQPSQLFDLTELQREMNKKHGLSAADTLKAAQGLYEQKALTYPRTDSRYLTSDMKSKIPPILKNLQAVKKEEIAPLSLSSLPFTKRIVDDKKVSDHHAIIPTGKIPTGLSGTWGLVYDAVVTRTIAVFYPHCLKEHTTVDAKAGKTPFHAKGVVILSPGWTALYPQKNDGDEQHLPAFTTGEEGEHKPFVKEGKTKPPKYFSENTLLGAMETAGNMVDDDTLKEALKEKGIGTPATRASIIETLIKRGYIARNKKRVTATELGRYLIALVQDPALKSPELTGDWEAKLREIERGELPPETFLKQIVAFTQHMIVTSDITNTNPTSYGSCPLCNAPIIRGKKGFGCSLWKDGCTYVLWREYNDITLTDENVRTLLQHKILHTPLCHNGDSHYAITISHDGHLDQIPLPKHQPSRSRS